MPTEMNTEALRSETVFYGKMTEFYCVLPVSGVLKF